MPPLQIATLTPAAVQQSLQNNGLAALGLTTVALTTRWADATPAANAYDSSALTLNVGQVRAPFLGIRENAYTDAASTSRPISRRRRRRSRCSRRRRRIPAPPAAAAF